MAIEIRKLEGLEEIHRCEELQKQIWGFEDRSVVPHHVLITAQKGGGVLLGAFEGERMIGFVFGFPGLEDGRPKHCSLMCGVLDERRFRGVGYQLKLKQREIVLSQGLELITWTYDPLQSVNAYFNFAKLGVIARRYERDLYGDIRDELNRGLPTDRFLVEWWIKSPRVCSRVEQGERPDFPEGLPMINRTDLKGALLVNVEYDLDLEKERLLVEIPWDIQGLKEVDLKLAQRWRQETREIFEGYLQRGYVVTEFFTVEREGRKRGFYLLERRPVQDKKVDPSIAL